MNDALVQSILGFTLDARKILEREADEQLQGIYGWLPDGSFTPADKMPAVAQLEEAKETRARLERFTEDERAADVLAQPARKKLMREAAFTWLNRLVAFRMMEERQLLRRTISRLHGSGAYVSWVTGDANAEARKLHDAGEVPANPMGEGPRHVAYRRFLLWQCGELAWDVSILLDPGTLASRLCPRPPILKQLVEAMNAEHLVEAWKAGNEEVLGWTYEGFIEEENGEVFKKFSKGKKVLPEEIGAATQRFTPRWIVRFLVENSLGRIWLEMHPDSRLAGSLAYFVPVEKKSARPLKPVRDIDFLDPSCGSMHFGLVAFDLFVEMYREELERAGQNGWPPKASVEKPEDIAAAVVRHNLFGIDLDLRAVQISALTMFIKARTLQPGCKVTDLNFASANMEQISGGRLDTIISQAHFKHPIYERVLRGLISRMENSDQLGTLLRPEKALQELVAAERRDAEANLLLLPGLVPDQFKTPAGLEEFFSNLSEQILQELDGFVRTSRAAGRDPGHLVAEASKGLRFLRLVSRHYDVVATNPPYMSRRNMSPTMTTYLDDHFKEGKGDLYAAFILRCAELADLGGKVAMVTQQSFMFISSYEDLRVRLRAGFAIETMAHLGPRAFPNIAGEKVNTTAFIFERRAAKLECDCQVGVYFRLVREPDADSKRRNFEAVLIPHRQGATNALLFRYPQNDFDAIPGKPWVYWITTGLRGCFATGFCVGDICSPVAGLRTSDNTRFLRFWWEVGLRNIDRNCRSRQDAAASAKRWFPYMKGGKSCRWLGNQDYVIDWWKDGAQVSQAIMEAYPYLGRTWLGGNQDYFKEGVTWSDLTTGRFAARHSPGGFVFDVKGSCAFPKSVWLLMAVLNSKLAHVLLNMMNPTVSFQVGDISRLPMTQNQVTHLEKLAAQAVELSKQDAVESEIDCKFRRPTANIQAPQLRKKGLAENEQSLDRAIVEAYDLQPADVALIDLELGGAVADGAEADEPEAQATEDESDSDGETSPANWARSWISYATGTVLGRFEIGKPGGLGCGDFPAATVTAIRALIDPDGIMPCDDGHPQDIAARVVKCLELMQGASEAHDTIRTATGETSEPTEAVRGWLDRFTGAPDQSFWKYHSQLYRKRPVYWPLQSPRKKFTVWVFHEKFDKNTLFTVRNLVEERLRLLDREITDKRRAAGNNRRLAKQVDKLLDVADDLRDFSKRIKEITDRGYTPHIDDGVLLNAAPLHPLLPSWPDAQAAWEELEAGEYDWAQQAMEYWPDRVKKACQTNKSFAIAHGLA